MLGEAPSLSDFAATVIADLAPKWSCGDTVDPAIFEEAAGFGLFGAELPREAGGLGLDFLARTERFATLAAVDFGFAMSVVNTHNVALNLVRIGTEEQRAAYLPRMLAGQISACTALTEPTAGTDFAAIVTTALQDGSDWILNGEKTWIVNGRHAGLSIVFAQTKKIGDRDGIGGFLVDLTSPGATRYPIDSGFSMTSMGTGGFHLKDVRVPGENLLLRPGHAFKDILHEINAARAYVACFCDAMLSAALHDANTYGARRTSFGKPLNSYPAWRSLTDPAANALAVNKALTKTACQHVASGEDAQISAATAKVASVEACQTHLPALLHAMGAEGLNPQRCFTRHLAAAQVAGLTDGTTLILKERLARHAAKGGSS